MNAAPAAIHTIVPVTPGAPSSAPSLAELEDLLYDILASGADPSHPAGTLEAVQTFVHEHARSRKSQAEFIAFFQANDLPLSPVRPALLVLPPLDSRGRAGESPALAPTLEPDEPAPSPSAATSGKRLWAWVAAALVASGLGASGYYATLAVRDEFAHARAEAAESAAALANVRAEADALRAAMRENAAVMQRVEQKSDLLLQTMASPLDPNAK